LVDERANAWDWGKKGKNRVGNTNRMACYCCEREAKREERDDRFENEREETGNVKGTGWDEDREEALCPYGFLFFCKPVGLVDIEPPLVSSSNYLDRMARCMDPPFIESDFGGGRSSRSRRDIETSGRDDRREEEEEEEERERRETRRESGGTREGEKDIRMRNCV
jgi:hypothetical protein